MSRDESKLKLYRAKVTLEVCFLAEERFKEIEAYDSAGRCAIESTGGTGWVPGTAEIVELRVAGDIPEGWADQLPWFDESEYYPYEMTVAQWVKAGEGED